MKYLNYYNDFITEAKQLGIIYHYTTINGIYDMLRKNNFLLTSPMKYISFSRNYNMKSPELSIDKRAVRIVIDGDKLTNKYKIKPAQDNTNHVTRKDGEWEERFVKDTYSLSDKAEGIDIKDCILEIDIKREPPLEKVTGDSMNWYNYYKFGTNIYAKNPIEIQKKYREFIEKIQILKSNMPIKYVKDFIPYKFK